MTQHIRNQLHFRNTLRRRFKLRLAMSIQRTATEISYYQLPKDQQRMLLPKPSPGKDKQKKENTEKMEVQVPFSPSRKTV